MLADGISLMMLHPATSSLSALASLTFRVDILNYQLYPWYRPLLVAMAFPSPYSRLIFIPASTYVMSKTPVAILRTADVEGITEPDGRRCVTVWQLWRAYLHQMKVPLAPLGRLRVRKKRLTEEERLLPPKAISELLSVLDDDAQVAAGLGYYALARIEEVLDVRLCDLALLGAEPYLEIRDGKGGKARRVYLTHAPATLSSGCGRRRQRSFVPLMPVCQCRCVCVSH